MVVAMFDDLESPLDEETKAELKSQWRQNLMRDGFGSKGASAVIIGLLAMCMLWAPSNNFDVYFRWSQFISAPEGGLREWPISTVFGIFVVKEVFMFWMMGMPISSEALHFNGFVVGGVCGLAMLVSGWFDYEGHNLLSVWVGKPCVAVVPKMPHQIAAATGTVSTTLPLTPPAPATPAPATSQPFTSQPFTPQPLVGSAAVPFDQNQSLPEFDDGSRQIGPKIALIQEIEAAVGRGEHATALR
jgi:hypothetical protein